MQNFRGEGSNPPPPPMSMVNVHMKKLFLLFWCSIFVVASLWQLCAAQEPVVTVEAWGKDRDDAMLQARREAIAQGIGVMLTSKTEVNNFILKKDVVLSRLTGAVKKVTVLEERKEAGGTYYLKVRAVLAEDSIKKDLMALHLLNYEMDYPRLLVLLKNDRSDQGTVVITDYLISKGFQVVEPYTVSGKLGIDARQLDELYTGSPTVIAAIGEKSGANYVVLAKLETQAVENDFLKTSGLCSCRSTITARIVTSNSGTVVASKTASGTAAHLSADSARMMSIQKAAVHLLDDALFDQLIESFQNAVNNGFMLQLHVANVESYSLEKKIRQLLAQQDVISLHSKGFSGKSVDLTVQVKGTALDFCDQINGQQISDRKIFVTECQGDKVSLELRAH